MARRRPVRPNVAAPVPAPPPAPRQISRLRILFTGLVLGLLLGVVMCVVLWAVGWIDGDDGFAWFYRIVTTGLIGMVAATIIGPVRAARSDGTLEPRRGLLRRRRS